MEFPGEKPLRQLFDLLVSEVTLCPEHHSWVQLGVSDFAVEVENVVIVATRMDSLQRCLIFVCASCDIPEARKVLSWYRSKMSHYVMFSSWKCILPLWQRFSSFFTSPPMSLIDLSRLKVGHTLRLLVLRRKHSLLSGIEDPPTDERGLGICSDYLKPFLQKMDGKFTTDGRGGWWDQLKYFLKWGVYFPEDITATIYARSPWRRNELIPGQVTQLRSMYKKPSELQFGHRKKFFSLC